MTDTDMTDDVKISVVSNVGGAVTKKRRKFRYPAHSLQEKFYCKPIGLEPVEYPTDVPFGASKMVVREVAKRRTYKKHAK